MFFYWKLMCWCINISKPPGPIKKHILEPTTRLHRNYEYSYDLCYIRWIPDYTSIVWNVLRIFHRYINWFNSARPEKLHHLVSVPVCQFGTNGGEYLDESGGVGGERRAIDVRAEGTNACCQATQWGLQPHLNYCCNKVAGPARQVCTMHGFVNYMSLDKMHKRLYLLWMVLMLFLMLML